MYNYSGLWYNIITSSGVLLLFGILYFLIKKPWKKRLWLMGGIAIVAACIGFGLYYGSALMHPNVNHMEGEFEYMRVSRAQGGFVPLDYAFVFLDDNQKETLYMDYFSKQDIYPNQLVQGMKYMIFYEEKTRIIVKLELLTGSYSGAIGRCDIYQD